MKIDINLINRSITNEELLDDLKSVISKYKLNSITISTYDKLGKYSSSALIRRFGTWNKALSLIKASLNHQYYSEEELFENIEHCWLVIGKQPVRRDMDNKLISSISSSTYLSRFTTWSNALLRFKDYINNKNDIDISITNQSEFSNKRTSRYPNNRLKIQVLLRDGNKCRLCGSTCDSGLNNIHFDHIKPYSKGGETVLTNLQILCSECNLAKGNYYNDEQSKP